MNKSDIINEIAKQTGMTKVDITKVFDAFVDAIYAAAKAKKDVRIIELFTLTVKHRAASQGKNPRTGAAITIPAANVPKFKAPKKLKDALNG
ncbi:HU family DNA-binding protein [Rickettsiales endosymbiont of Stachyamoeba lipophora]|uniref:HU family DNA-binding protein n=1 Tax=Rickettsiales endosymbiont of Stachyamoeba lipophora TaxID=2486578 RepID=UPI000F64D507|nr:HU family DNA-binding protein [Rickettsiales endosymbiont of Stachyamoeba lipophora]AZL15070.1 HU family DNA-binding protein [Rickettsiales endosymbiont of Stachyamoeba lipophora]